LAVKSAAKRSIIARVSITPSARGSMSGRAAMQAPEAWQA
jgi:hypothetical protein